MKTLTKPVHVLLLVDVLHGLDFSGRTVKGLAGLEAALLKVIRAMHHERYRFSVATFSLGKALPADGQFPCPLHVFPLKRTYDWNAFRMAIKLRRLIRSENVKIVHTFFESADIWGGLVARLSGCPILVSSRRDMGCFRSLKHKLGYQVVNHFVDQVQAVSDQVRTFLVSNDGINPQKVVTLHNGVDMKSFAAENGTGDLRAQLHLEPGDHVISTVANIRPVKGIDVLLRAAVLVCREFPRARFLIVGEVIDQPYFYQIKEFVRAFDLTDNVLFLGRSTKVSSLLKLSSLFCLLSRSEGFSNAILEAMACGLPCVVTNVGGNAEALEDGRSGFLVSSEDAAAAAARIVMLLRDPHLAKQMGEVGRETVATRFTVDVMVDRWARLYDGLLESSRN